MRDVQNLRELILGLAIITPVGCQSPPPAIGDGSTVEQAQPEAEGLATEAASVEAASVEAPEREERRAEEPVFEGPAVEGSGLGAVNTAVDVSRGALSSVVSWSATHVNQMAWREEQERQRKQRMEPCMTLAEVNETKRSFYDREYELWKSQASLRKEPKRNRAKRNPKHGPALVAKPKKPREAKTCPKSLITNISRSRCQTLITQFDLTSQHKNDEGDLVCCFVNPRGKNHRRPCGRLFYVEEEATRAQTSANRSWMGADVERPRGVSQELAMEAAQAWLEDALEEHASVAAFSRATLELMALGAPSKLLAEYQRASLDEIEHARLCFSLVGALLGREVSAGVLEVEGPRDDLDAIIADVFWGGCVGESVAALCAQRALAGCSWAPAKQALEVISEDEAKHAALAWSTLSFLGEAMPERVRRVLGAAEPPVRHTRMGGAEDEAWSALGRLTPAQEERAAQDAWEQLIEPMLGELLR